MPKSLSMTPTRQLEIFGDGLARVRDGSLGAQAFSTLARAQDQLLAALAPRYTDVLHQLLDRLESSALFTEESCSFSQKDLLDSLQMWQDKAALSLRA
jgi:hypothetical protein